MNIYKIGEDMFKMWIKLFQDTHLIDDVTVERPEVDTRTHKIFGAIEDACIKFDLSKPIWLESNIKEFKRISKTRFSQDNFIEEISFDYMEIQILEDE